MDPRTLALTLAIAAGWLSFNTLVIVGYFLFCKKEALGLAAGRDSFWLTVAGKRARQSAVSPRVKPSSVPVNESAAVAKPTPSAELDNAPPSSPPTLPPIASYSLFVIFDQPDVTLNQKIHALLQAWEARYDASLQLYIASGVTPQNPIRIANAYPPGDMPADEVFLEETNVLGGVSLIVEKPKRKRGFDKVQLGKLVELSEEFAALGGSILDEERQPASRKTFKNITGS
ncbi:hypothetical protein [Halomonas sp.]|uniref:hypothetical protein n=1 Tax=Halomonas sp. TaxID=1486246 RepID=UPI003A93D4F6